MPIPGNKNKGREGVPQPDLSLGKKSFTRHSCKNIAGELEERMDLIHPLHLLLKHVSL
jgi:hypothetical protein